MDAFTDSDGSGVTAERILEVIQNLLDFSHKYDGGDQSQVDALQLREQIQKEGLSSNPLKPKEFSSQNYKDIGNGVYLRTDLYQLHIKTSESPYGISLSQENISALNAALDAKYGTKTVVMRASDDEIEF